MDQAALFRSRGFPTAMVLPITIPAMDANATTGIR